MVFPVAKEAQLGLFRQCGGAIPASQRNIVAVEEGVVNQRQKTVLLGGEITVEGFPGNIQLTAQICQRDFFIRLATQQIQEALFQLSGLRTIALREDLQPKLQDLLNHGEIIQMANQLFDQVLFLNIKTKDNEWTYETTVTNTSSLTFEYFTFEIDLVDENENIVATETSTAKNWKPGQEVRFNFVTKELFHAIRVDSANWKIAAK